MSVLSKELVQEIIAENDCKNPGEIISFLKEAFKDVLLGVLFCCNKYADISLAACTHRLAITNIRLVQTI